MTRRRHSIAWKKFGREIATTRERSGLSVRELARDMGMSHSTLSRAENGKPVDAAHYTLLCAYLAVHPQKFL